MEQQHGGVRLKLASKQSRRGEATQSHIRRFVTTGAGSSAQVTDTSATTVVVLTVAYQSVSEGACVGACASPAAYKVVGEEEIVAVEAVAAMTHSAFSVWPHTVGKATVMLSPNRVWTCSKL